MVGVAGSCPSFLSLRREAAASSPTTSPGTLLSLRTGSGHTPSCSPASGASAPCGRGGAGGGVLLGLGSVKALIAGLLERLRSLRPAWGDVVREVWSGEAERFAAGGDPAWPPLNPTYAAWKAKRFPGRPLLVRTGRLYRSLTGRGTGADARVALGDREVRIGTRVPYTVWHVRGTQNMPVRDPMGMSPATFEAISARIAQHIFEPLEGRDAWRS